MAYVTSSQRSIERPWSLEKQVVSGILVFLVDGSAQFFNQRYGLIVGIIFLMLSHGVTGNEIALELNELTDGSTVEVTGPLSQPYRYGDDAIFIQGSRFEIVSDTRFVGVKGRRKRQLVLEQGSWVKITAIRADSLRWEVSKLKRLKNGKFFMLVRLNETDPVVLPIQPDRTASPISSFLEDESKSAAFSYRLTDDLWLGGKLRQNYRFDDERDLNAKKPADEHNLSYSFSLDLLWRNPISGSLALFEPQASYSFESDELSSSYNSEYQLARGYGYLTLGDFFAVQIGRQDFDDDREWIYDQILDGVRLYTFAGAFRAELSLSTGRSFAAPKNSHEDIANVALNLKYFVDKKHYYSLWAVSRFDRTEQNVSPTLIGFRSLDTRNSGLRHWFDSAYSFGEIGATAVNGFGIDAGVAYLFRTMPKPYLILGLAFGSGQQGDSQDGAFRQTGLHDNAGKFGGISSYHYYGEAFNPELSNKLISTVGFGIRPVPKLSVDALLHSYTQAEFSTDLGETRIKAKPNGLSTELGYGLDIVFGSRMKDLAVTVIVSRFQPGDAFKTKDASHLVELGLELKL